MLASTIYVDQVFFVNAAVDVFLLKTAVSVTGCGVRPWRLWAGAGCGGLTAVLACLPALTWLGRLPWALLPFAGLSALCFGWRGRAWKSWLWFFCVCCGFAGLALAFCNLLRVPAFFSGGVVYYRVSGRLLVLLAAAVYAAVRLCLDRFARNSGRELVRLELTLSGSCLSCLALRDTGNSLSDPTSGEPVLVAGWQIAARLLPELHLRRDEFEDPAGLLLRLGAAKPSLRVRLIPFRAVGTEGGLLPALTMDRITEDGRLSATRLVAFSPTELSDGGSYEALCQA